jgi:nucleotide-binding universal stress UspA family protein
MWSRGPRATLDDMFTTVIAGVHDSSADADALALAQLLVQSGGAVVPTRIEPGRPVGPGLHEAAVASAADLIVVGSSARGVLGRILAGDDVIATLRGAPCAVAIAPHGFASAAHPIARIGVGYDGRRQAHAALDAAKALAARTGASVRALGVSSPPQGLVAPVGIAAVEALEAGRDRAERAFAQLGPDVSGHVVDGIAHLRLADLSSEVDLLVVGSSRRGAFGRVLMGSTSERLSRQAACPLLVVPAPESSQPAPERRDRPASAPAG